MIKLGDKVVLKNDIIEEAGETPGGVCGKKGDVVIVDKISDLYYPLKVHHENITDGRTFSVKHKEVEKLYE